MSYSENTINGNGNAVAHQSREDDEVLKADLLDALSGEIEALKSDARELLRRRHQLVVLRRNLTDSPPQSHHERSAQPLH